MSEDLHGIRSVAENAARNPVELAHLFEQVQPMENNAAQIFRFRYIRSPWYVRAWRYIIHRFR